MFSPVLCLALALLQARSLAQQTAIVTGGFNGYEGARDGCELINKARTSPHTCSQKYFILFFISVKIYFLFISVKIFYRYLFLKFIDILKNIYRYF